jgi:hypothetical protein
VGKGEGFDFYYAKAIRSIKVLPRAWRGWNQKLIKIVLHNFYRALKHNIYQNINSSQLVLLSS